MNELLRQLRGGDLRSDGYASEVADVVLAHPDLFELLLEGLDDDQDVVRGRTAHALERVSRTRPDLLRPHLARLLRAAGDDLPMVRWHAAMILANLALEVPPDVLQAALLGMLGDGSVFVRSWAVSGLAILAVAHPELANATIPALEVLQQDHSVAIGTRVRKALATLREDEPLPAGWVKSRVLFL
jgi:HEAT repeat protein